MIEKKQRVPRQKSLTSVDVAHKAGVSRTAVSYVLNGAQNAHVSEEKRARVLQAAQELGYHMNTSAQALRKGQSNEICILSSISMSANDAEIFMSLQQHALLHGYVPAVYFVGGLTTEQQKELLLRLVASRPLALFLGPGCINAEYIALAQQTGTKYILLGVAELLEEHLLATLPSVSIPTRELGYLAAQHLLERGHRHLGILHPDDPRHELAFQQRLQGMHAAIAEAETQPEAIRLDIFPMHFSMSGAHTLVDTYLIGAERATGIYAFNDEYALPLMGALNDRGIRIPQDVAIIGTDNVSFSAFVRPALTTINIDNVALGQRGIEMLVALDKGKPLSADLTQSPTPELIIRAST
jgi:LacI family transcriptional regulator